MKMFEEMTLKRFLIGTARNLGIGVVLGVAFWGWMVVYIQIMPYASMFDFLVYLPLIVVSAVINFFIGKTIKWKILNTFIVCIIAFVIATIIAAAMLTHTFMNW